MLATRPFLKIAFASAISLLLLTAFLLSSQRYQQLNLLLPPLLSKLQQHGSKDILQVYLTDTSLSHDEVIAAYVHSFGSQPNINMSLFQTESRYGMSDIVSNFTLPRPVPEPLHPSTVGGPLVPDIMITSTCNFDFNNLKDRYNEFLKLGKTYVFCTIHHADWWNKEDMEERLKPWIDKNLISIVFLSAHTARYFKEYGMSNWQAPTRKKASKVVKVLTPVFPVSLPSLSDSVSDTIHIPAKNATPPHVSGIENEIAFALQGNYESSRRDFKRVFSDLESLLKSSDTNTLSSSSNPSSHPTKNITLHLLGHGPNPPKVPENLKPHVIFDEDLPYPAYYNLLSHCTAVLPAFASPEYLDRKASSSVPAALLGGVPLIADKDLVGNYSYLGADTFYLQDSHEGAGLGKTELEVMQAIIKMPEEQRIHMKKRVRERSEDLQRENVEMVARWIREARRRVGV